MNSLVREKKRLFEEMSVELQEVAIALNRNDHLAFKGVLKLKHQGGSKLIEVRENPALYGPKAFKQLAGYLNCKVDQLYKLVRLAENFSHEEIEVIADRVAESSVHFTPSHLLELCQVEKIKDREQILETCLAGSHTVREVRRLVASAKKKQKQGVGRKPKRITSVPAGMHEMAKRTSSYQKLMQVWKEDVFDRLDDVSPAEFTEELARDARQAHSGLENLIAKQQKGIQRLLKIKERYESFGNKWPDVTPR